MGSPCFFRISKKTFPYFPGFIDPNNNCAVVRPSDYVPVEIRFTPFAGTTSVGVDVIFLIDDSNDMCLNDDSGERYKAILSLVDAFEQSRNNLDRIAIYQFVGNCGRQIQSWKSWGETRTTINSLNISAGGLVPLADGMKQVNELFKTSSNAALKLAIITSALPHLQFLDCDTGWPTPDSSTSAPVETILFEQLCKEAFLNRILYATVYLSTDAARVNQHAAPDDNPLLERIAKSTDFITHYSSDYQKARFYYRITHSNQLANTYMDIFSTFANNKWPQDVRIREQISDKLFVDRDARIEFTGNFLELSQRVIGYGSTGVTTFQGAIDYFRQNGIFELQLNQLDGEATLSFGVKLNTSQINLASYSEDRVCVDVDKLSTPISNGSFVSYLKNLENSPSFQTNQQFPQATICFMKGLSVTKTITSEPNATNQSIESNLVRIEMVNFNLSSLDAVQIAEFPSAFLNTSIEEDDCDFRPLELLLRNRIVPYIVERIIVELENTNRNTEATLLKQNMRVAENFLLSNYLTATAPLESKIDQYLSQFWFADNFTATSSAGNEISQSFWQTPCQTGIYKILRNVPPIASKFIKFRVYNAAFHLKSGLLGAVLTMPVDACKPEQGFLRPRSVYASTPNINQWNDIEPNPDYTQYSVEAQIPDLYTHTCFSYDNLDRLYALFSEKPTETSMVDYWKVLDSPDISSYWVVRQTPITQPPSPTNLLLKALEMGVTVRVYNGGITSSLPTKMTAISIYIPVLGNEIITNSQSLEILMSTNFKRIFLAEGICDVQKTGTYKILYENQNIRYVDGQKEVVSYDYIKQVKAAVVINIITIFPYSNQGSSRKRMAIEVVRAKPSTSSFSIH
jgi:hypothetical protein